MIGSWYRPGLHVNIIYTGRWIDPCNYTATPVPDLNGCGQSGAAFCKQVHAIRLAADGKDPRGKGPFIVNEYFDHRAIQVNMPVNRLTGGQGKKFSLQVPGGYSDW